MLMPYKIFNEFDNVFSMQNVEKHQQVFSRDNLKIFFIQIVNRLEKKY